MGARTEILGSRRRSMVGHDHMTVTHVFHVLNETPEDAWRNAVPPLPEVGSQLGDLQLSENAYSLDAIIDALNRGVQLRRIETDWVSGSKTHSQVTLHYASGVDVSLEFGSGLRKVIWEDDVVLETETIYFDIDTDEPIPNGAQVRMPVVNSTATLEGARLTLNMQNFAGTVNEFAFRMWEPGWLLYTGASTRLIHGYDSADLAGAESGRATVQLTFMGRVGGWQERRPVLNAQGVPTGMWTEFKKYNTFNVVSLFPNGWDPGI